MAKMTPTDFIEEAKNRGFTGFGDGALLRFLNFSYMYVAYMNRWAWEDQTYAPVLSPGTVTVDVASFPFGMVALESCFVTTTSYEKKLEPMVPLDFEENWLPFDLTQATRRAEPNWYYMFNQKVYIIPPPSNNRTLLLKYKARPTELDTGTPLITPIEFDEPILMKLLQHCHTRAHELQDAGAVRSTAEEALINLQSQDEEKFDEGEDRVEAERTWF